ncbi:MAG TPA: hypothetical protein VI299_17420 [Polyangiales bacterium]
MRKLWWGAAALAVHALWAGPALADRRSGLAGNLLIEDPDDLFGFPQLTLQHRNMFRLDYGGNAQTGNGVITLGNEREALAIALHRGDLLTPDVVGYNTELAWLGGVEGVGGPFGNTSYGAFPGPAAVGRDARNVLPATVLDLSYARSINGNPFGVRLGFGRGVQAVRDGEDNVTKGAQTFFAAQLGYSKRPATGLRWDASANAVFAFGNANDANGDDAYSGWDLRVAGLGRAYYPINPLVDIGFLGNVSIGGEHTEATQLGDTSKDIDFGLRAGVGPALHLDRAKIAAYGGLRLGVGKNDASTLSDGTQNRLDVAAPYFNMAAEVQVLDWLYVRTGAEYTWQVQRTNDTQKERSGDGAFRWSAGLGFQKGTFYFDGVVTNGFVTGGPNFIGGTAPGFLAMASLTYKFGDVFGSPPPAQAEERALVIERPAPPVSEPAVTEPKPDTPTP